MELPLRWFGLGPSTVGNFGSVVMSVASASPRNGVRGDPLLKLVDLQALSVLISLHHKSSENSYDH